MCGISGILSLTPHPPQKEWLEKMSRRLSHRGPDGHALHEWKQCALAHERLSIIDVAGGKQPLLNEDRTLGAVVNGEIYNHVELRRSLEEKGHRFSTFSDSEVILHGYEQEGRKFFSRLDGMFALAIWDDRKRKLILARDGLGKKPLALARISGVLTFASEVSAFREIPGFDTTLSSEALAHYLQFRCVGQPNSIFRHAVKVSPGCSLEFDASTGLSNEERFWKLPKHHDHSTSGVINISLHDAKAELRRLIIRAVEKRLMSEVPLGVLLSGGIDSSVVAYEASLLKPNIETFTMGFEGASDEIGQATKTACLMKWTHTAARLSMDPAKALITAMKAYDEPFADSSALPSVLVCQTARRGVTVVLNGDGGDEAMAGYNHHRLFLRSLEAEEFPMRLALAPFAWWMAKWMPRAWKEDMRQQWQGAQLSAQWPDHFERWIAQHQVFSMNECAELVDKQSAASVVPLPLGEFGAAEAEEHDYLHYLSNQLLVKMDRASMATHLEARSPFLDDDLIRFCRALPTEWKITALGQGKRLIRETYRDLLPEHLWTAPKQGFQAPVKQWLRGPLREKIVDLSEDPKCPVWNHIRREPARHHLQRFLHGAGNEQRIWSLLVLNEWLIQSGL